MNPKNRLTVPHASSHLSGNPHRRILSIMTAALVGAASLASSHAATWLNENFQNYGPSITTAAPTLAPNTTLSPLLISTGTAAKVFADTGANDKMRYLKAAATDSGNGTYFAMSSAYATNRQQGYFSFKITTGTTPDAVPGSFFQVALGANDSYSMSSNTNAWVALRFYYNKSGGNFRIYTQATQTFPASGYTTLPTTENYVQVWYNRTNGTSSGMVYTDPSGVSRTLGLNNYVVYINGTLMSTGANGVGTALPPSITSNSITGITTIGKIGILAGASGGAGEYIFDDVYAGDTAPTAMAIVSSATAAGQVTSPFSYQVLASFGTPTSYSASNLPAGLSINASTGAITGTPTSAGTYTVGLTVSNGTPAQNGTQDLTITVAEAPQIKPVVTSDSRSGIVGAAFSYQVVATESPTNYAITAGTLPAGLSLNAATGVISGTPTSLAKGSTTVTITATNVSGSGAADVSFTINNPLQNTFNGGTWTTDVPPVSTVGSGSNLGDSLAWSAGASLSSSSSAGSYSDVLLDSTATALTVSSGNFYSKSLNVTNGGSYTVTSVSPTTTSIKLGATGITDTATFYNGISDVSNDLISLSGGSSLALSATNNYTVSTATATATLTGDLVTELLVGSGGSGYAVAPTVTISAAEGDTTGSGASATAVLVVGGTKVASINITNAGSGYTLPPIVTLSAPPAVATTPTTVLLRNSGNLNIGAGSTLNISPVISGAFKLTKTGLGTATLGGTNTYTGGTAVSAGTLNANAVNSLGTGALTVNGGTLNIGAANAINSTTILGGQLTTNASNALGTTGATTFTGGTLTANADLDLAHITLVSTTSGSITFNKPTGLSTTTFNGATTLEVGDGATLSALALAGNSNAASLITKKGLGTLWLRGGSAATLMGGWSIEAGTLFVSTTSSTGLGSGKVSMNGGNLRFSKGPSSTGTYTGHGQDAALEVLKDTTITMDSNPLTPSGSNTASFPSLAIGAKTIHLVKSAEAKSSADSGYVDPIMTFNTATLSGIATLDVGALTQMTLQAGTGAGGVIKTGLGKLKLSDNVIVAGAATATSSLTNDTVGALNLTAGGVNYTATPTVTIEAPTSGTTATATATVVGGVVTALEITNPGSGYTTAPTVTFSSPRVPNTYTGATTINAGTLALSGSHTSAISMATGTVLELALSDTTTSATSTNSLTLTGNVNVKIIGTPTLSSYTLISASSIAGTPVLETAISGYSLVVDGSSLKLNAITTPTISTVPTASDITYGQTLASSSLTGGSASVAGTFAFTTPSTVPSIGTAAQGFTFTPTDTTNYSTVTGSVSVTVTKATPTVNTVPTASSITYGQTLASSSLTSGSASVAGSFAFTTPSTVPSAGTATQGFTFTPSDTTNYNTVTGSVSVSVAKATPTVNTAPTASPITYGQTLASSSLTNGAASVAGTFAFTTPSTAPNAGTATQGFTFTPSDTTNYNTVTGSVSVSVAKATPTVNTAPTATAITSGQTLASSTLSGGSASVAGTFAFTTPSTVPTVTASQAVTFTPTDSANYNTASTTASVTVNAAAGYSTWATTNNLSGADALSSADPDKDGIKNGVEYVLGGNPMVSDAATIAPTGAKSGTNYIYTLKRTDASEADATVTVEYGNNLSGWTSYSIGATTVSPVVITENDTAADTVVVTIPNASATKFFARLKVVAP